MTQATTKQVRVTLDLNVTIDDGKIDELQLNGTEAKAHDRAMLSAILNADPERLKEAIAHEVAWYMMWKDACFFEKWLLGKALPSGWHRETFKPALEQLTGKAREWWQETWNAEPNPEIGDLFRDDIDKILECFKVEFAGSSFEIEASEEEADREAGRLIPGGFDAIGEFTEDLEAALKALIGRVRQGVMVRDQEALTRQINAFAEIEALKSLPDNEIDTSDIPEITDFSGFQRGLPWRTEQSNSKDSIELWKRNPRKAFNHHLGFMQRMCAGIEASLDKLRKGMEEQGLFSDNKQDQ